MALHISVARMLRCCSALLQGKADSSTTSLFTNLLIYSNLDDGVTGYFFKRNFKSRRPFLCIRSRRNGTVF